MGLQRDQSRLELTWWLCFRLQVGLSLDPHYVLAQSSSNSVQTEEPSATWVIPIVMKETEIKAILARTCQVSTCLSSANILLTNMVIRIVPKDVHVLIAGTCEYITLYSKRDFIDVIKIMILKIGTYLYYKIIYMDPT